MPEVFSPELVKALAGNVYTVKEESSINDEMAAAWKEYMKEEKKDDKWDDQCDKKDDKKHDRKHDKKEDKKSEPTDRWHDEDECCCPKKVKFIFFMNNAVIINVNAVCEEEDNHNSDPCRPS
jgi:hypothetical protein